MSRIFLLTVLAFVVLSACATPTPVQQEITDQSYPVVTVFRSPT